MSAARSIADGIRNGALRGLCATWEDVQEARLAADQRGLPPVAVELKKLEDKLARDVRKELQRHPLYDWLPSGLRGVHVARLLAIIGDPWRFPGRRCSRGHYLSVADRADGFEGQPGDDTTAAILPAFDDLDGDGGPCPVVTAEGSCDGTLLPPRPGTGVRSLWHYCGLHVVDGHSPRRRKGQVADWNPIARTIVLMPGGIAEQIVRLRVAKYRDTYDATKARLTDTRAVLAREAEQIVGAQEGGEVEGRRALAHQVGLRPFQIDAIARKVAAKQFIGDLLMEWKRRLPVEAAEIEASRGEAAA